MTSNVKYLSLTVVSLIVAAGCGSVQAQTSQIKLGAPEPGIRHQTKLTLSSSDEAQIHQAAQMLAATGHSVTMTETHTQGGGSRTWSFDSASSPMFRASEVKPEKSALFSVSAVAYNDASSARGSDKVFNCVQWTSKFNVKCTLEMVE